MPPVMRRDFEHRPRRSRIEQTECGTLRPGRVFGTSNGYHGDGTSEQTPDLRLLLYGHGEIVPTRHAQIRPMIDTAGSIGVDEAPDGGGGAAGPGGSADLIADHSNLWPFAHQPEHREHKITPRGGIYPGSAQHDAVCSSSQYLTLAP